VRCSVSNRIIIIFIDGIGIGNLSPSFNPCFYSKTGIFSSTNKELPWEGLLFPLDAQLGISGLPQSATGHTTIYSGINAPALIKKHLYGFPNAELRMALREKSLFVRLIRKGLNCKFMNAFRPIFFTSPELFKNKHMSATTEMNKYAGLPFADFSQIKGHKALYHDYTNGEPVSKGFDLPVFSARQAAQILVNESALNNVVLYEYFMTDFAGHACDMETAVNEIHLVENLIMAVLKKIDMRETSLLVVSDHGNIEDLRTKSHTLNPAFFGIWGDRLKKSNLDLNSLLDVCPLILSLF
jgi:bisphosphoglycerate-independent phosphoglycerate mutase (AlkP superfamily)